ncbi:hypothetical protein [uncultured Microbulbifer sp.]|uniref:hypothetical protein n=1 Tax=uncultured Microbulbifer sp. TaxID=348147 RepID=UPI002618A948|nr:hypothetical protein [uncultured Microbulbifer sp.]
MNETCHYHTRVDASWQCQPCQRQYCSACIPGSSANYRGQGPECPLCHKPLTFIGASNSARPFWQMGLFYLIYALKAGPLTVLALAAGASLLITGPGLVAIVVLVATIALVTRYSLLVIERLAGGQLAAPPFEDTLDGNSAALLLKVIGMILIAGFVGYKLVALGSAAVQIYALALSLLTPAAMIVLALEHSLRAAINPLKLLQFTLIIGWPYWLLWLTITAISAAPGFLVAATAAKLPPWAIGPVIAASTTYFTIVTSAMMGYICLSRQQQLGIHADPDEDSTYLEEAAFKRARILAEAQILMRESDFKSARQALVEGLRRYPNDEALNERYYRLLLAAGDKKALRELGPHLLDTFVHLNRAHKAAELFLATEPAPPIQKPALRHALAQELYQRHQYPLAARLLNNLHRENYAHLDAAYLLLAQIYMDGLNREDLARKLLQFVREKFPHSPLRAQAETLWKVLNSVRASG